MPGFSHESTLFTADPKETFELTYDLNEVVVRPSLTKLLINLSLVQHKDIPWLQCELKQAW